MGKKYYKAKNYQITKYLRIAGLGCILGGLGIFIYFLFPLVAYQFFLGAPVQAQEIESPVPKYLIGRNSNVRSLIGQGISRLQFDYKDARNWYPQVHAEEKKNEKISNYLLSIPSLGIQNANVSTTDYDLSKTLVHYYGPENPLDHGTSVIFGHSTLPQWFDPTNYEAIFATPTNYIEHN